MADEKPSLQLRLNPSRLASIIDKAVVASSEVVNFHFNALASADLSQPAQASDARCRFLAPAISAADRKAAHENWILARAFHELLRAVRHSLEEAYVFVSLLTGKHRVNSSASLSEFLAPFRRKAAGFRFPELMEAVNSKLERKLNFSTAYISLQQARNCLEHRDGIISKIETHGGEIFSLHIPRIKVFYERNGTEIEIEREHVIDPGDDRAEVEVMMRLETRERSIPLGGRLSFTIEEYNEVAFACHYLGQQLSTKLPRPKVAPDAGNHLSSQR